MISDKTLKRVANYTENEINEALDNWENRIEMPPQKEELGGDFYFKCGWLKCSADIKSGDNYCRECGTKIKWDER